MLKKIQSVIEAIRIVLALADMLAQFKSEFEKELTEIRAITGKFLTELETYAKTTKPDFDDALIKRVRELLKI